MSARNPNKHPLQVVQDDTRQAQTTVEHNGSHAEDVELLSPAAHNKTGEGTEKADNNQDRESIQLAWIGGGVRLRSSSSSIAVAEASTPGYGFTRTV